MGEPLGAREPLIAGWAVPCVAGLLCAPCWAGLLGAPVGGGPPAHRPRCVLLLVAPLVFRAPEGPAAREARRPHFVRSRASKPARALRTLRRPPHSGAWSLMCGSVR